MAATAVAAPAAVPSAVPAAGGGAAPAGTGSSALASLQSSPQLAGVMAVAARLKDYAANAFAEVRCVARDIVLKGRGGALSAIAWTFFAPPFPTSPQNLTSFRPPKPNQSPLKQQRKPWAEVFDRSSFSKPATLQEVRDRRAFGMDLTERRRRDEPTALSLSLSSLASSPFPHPPNNNKPNQHRNTKTQKTK